jgi:retinol dehydrogenase-12
MFLASAICQMFPGAPTYTEKNIADLTGKVYVVTGANTGIGKLVAQTLYQKNATVWVAARNEDKATQAIASIRDSCPGSAGALKFLHLDLSDLVAVKRAAETFLAGGTRLDVLFNNAGVMIPPADSVTAQGYELQLGTNCLGHFLLAKLLTPRLVETAKSAPKDSVRVVWLSSSAAELLTIGAGVNIDNLDYHQPVLYPFKYGTSKAGNYLQATEYARRYKEDGVVSVVSANLRRHPYGCESEARD